MDKRIAFVLVATLLVVGWLWWPRDDGSVATPVAAGANRAGAGAAQAAEAETGASRREVPTERAAANVAAAGGAGANDADAEPMGELLVQVAWADGEKAPGVRVYFARSTPGASRPLAELVSDAAGQARAHVSTGKVLVTSDRGRGENENELEVEVVAGQRHEVRLVLPVGVDVEGVVRDGAGAPVPGARIWLSSYQVAWCAGAFVTEADAAGTFRLRAVPKEQSLGAVATGFAPSKLVDLDQLDTKQSPVRVELVLGDAGGALVGRVIDANGRSVGDVVVAVGASEDLIEPRAGGGMEERWAPRRAATDADGRYAIEGLLPGKHPVEMWAREFAIWRGGCTIEAQQTARLDVTLLRSVTVFGTVTGENGKPLAGACVRSFPGLIRMSFVQAGQYDYASTFGCPFAIADADGHYRLWGAAPPELHLYASPGRYPRGNDAVCWDDEVLHVQPGAVVEWNAKIEPGRVIHGVVRYRDGVPMPGVFIGLIEPGTKNLQTLRNDQEGRFRFVRLQKKAYDVSVQLWTQPKGTPPVEAREVWPDAGELELVAAFDAPKKGPRGSVRGVVVDAGGRLANPGALVVSLQVGIGHREGPKLEGGAFRFDKLDPGRMRLTVMSGEDPILFGEWFELQPAEDKDVGALVTEPGGTIRLRIVRHPGTESFEPIVSVRPVDARARNVKIGTATEVLVDNLCAGKQQLSAWHQGMATVRGTATVVAGVERPATIELWPAAVREIVVEYTATQRLKRIRVQDERGGEVSDYEPKRVLERPYRTKSQLPIGRFTLLVETEGGGKAQIAFEMTSLAAGQPPIVLEAK